MKILRMQLLPHMLPALGRGLSNSVGALIMAQDRHCSTSVSTHRPWPCPRLGLRVCRCWPCSRGCRASRSGDFHSCGPGHGGFNGLAEEIFHAYKVLKQFTITSLLREYCTLELCVELIMRNYPRSSTLALICIMQIIVMAAQHQAPGPCLFVFNFSSLMLYLCLELYWGTL